MNQLKYRVLTEEDKQQICAWEYTGEYKIYDLPSYDMMKAQKKGFMKPENEKNYFAFLDGDVLVGFVNISEEDTEVFIGIGVNPVLCGKHYGRRMLEEAYHISKRLYPKKPLYLEVRTWNMRAVMCYKNAGFHIDGEQHELTTGIGTGTFFRMVRG